MTTNIPQLLFIYGTAIDPSRSMIAVDYGISMSIW